ncbi:MAG TPA: L,D-transpeptidase [Gemmatimonadaceae bacterium]
MGLLQPFRDSPKIACGLVGAAVLLGAATAALVANTLDVRYHRDIERIVFNRNWDLLDDITAQTGAVTDSLRTALAASPAPTSDAYIVVSIEDRRLWYRKGDELVFSTRVAVGSGKTLVKHDGRDEYKFDTPRGRLVVQSKDADPIWVPPDWHYLELAKRKGLGLVHLTRGMNIPMPDGAVLTVVGSDVAKKYPDGRVIPLDVAEGREIVVGGNIIVPPYGTHQRRYDGVLGNHRLNLGDGYALHGTDDPTSIGHAVSHGCVRLRNEDIDFLYRIVPVGTPVFIY